MKVLVVSQDSVANSRTLDQYITDFKFQDIIFEFRVLEPKVFENSEYFDCLILTPEVIEIAIRVFANSEIKHKPIIAIINNNFDFELIPFEITEYIFKNSSFEELRFRIKNAIKTNSNYKHKDSEMVNKELIDISDFGLTYKELEILNILKNNVDKVLSRTDILKSLQNENEAGGIYENSRVIDVHIRRIRAKLGHRTRGI